jgi:hypothetical protein
VEINEAARVALGPGRHLEVPYAITRVLVAHVELVHVLQELGQEAMMMMTTMDTNHTRVLCVSARACAHTHTHIRGRHVQELGRELTHVGETVVLPRTRRRLPATWKWRR